MNVKCNKCGHVGPEAEFPKWYDFFQKPYIAGCPKNCGNQQSPGDASMRMFGGPRPFEYVREAAPTNVVATVMHRAEEAS